MATDAMDREDRRRHRAAGAGLALPGAFSLGSVVGGLDRIAAAAGRRICLGIFRAGGQLRRAAGGPRGDGLARRLVRAVAVHLAGPNGVATRSPCMDASSHTCAFTGLSPRLRVLSST